MMLEDLKVNSLQIITIIINIPMKVFLHVVRIAKSILVSRLIEVIRETKGGATGISGNKQ